MGRSQVVVGIVAKPNQPVANLLTKELIKYLESNKIDYRLDVDIAAELGLPAENNERIVERATLTAVANPIVVLGGDGTLISVSRHPVKTPPTIIGVNLGTLGFLTEITIEELFPTLEAVLAGSARLEKRYLLDTTVMRGAETVATFSAVNDAVITKEALARIFGVELLINGEFAALLRGDGVIVATPGGSTAYSLSAGGSIVHPQVEALLVTPICPHSLTTRPLVLPGTSRVTLKIAGTAKLKPGEVFLTIDGQVGMALSEGDIVESTLSTHSVIFAKSPSRGYFDILGAKLKWANH